MIFIDKRFPVWFSARKILFKLLLSKLWQKQYFILILLSHSITHLPLPHLKTKVRDRLDTERDIFHLIFGVNDGGLDLNQCITFTFWFMQMKIAFESAPCTRLPPSNAHFCCLVEQENRLDFSCSCKNIHSGLTDNRPIPYICILQLPLQSDTPDMIRVRVFATFNVL